MNSAPDTYIENARLLLPGVPAVLGSLLISGGRITRIDLGSSLPPIGCTKIDAGGRLVTPGLIDMHTHGLHAYMYNNGAEDLLAIARNLPRHGVTSVYPTLIPSQPSEFLDLLQRLTSAIPKAAGSVNIPGLHLEGPFVALPGAACVPRDGDVGYLKEMLAAAEDRVGIVSISPDTPNILPVIEHLRERNIAVFMTHTRASAEQTRAAIEAGARHATHFYNVFPLPAEQEPGVRPVGAFEAIYCDPRVSVDFICDGAHVPRIAVEMALVNKGVDRVAAITDSNIGAGMPEGTYPTPWGYPVRIRPGDGARIDDPKHPLYKCLAGSSLTMDQAIRNLLQWFKSSSFSEDQIWRMVSGTPARIMGLPTKGAIHKGADADLVVWNDDLTPARTFCAGSPVYSE